MNKTANTLALLSLSLILGACSQSSPSAPNAGNAIPMPDAIKAAHAAPQRWFVELTGDPTTLSSQSVGSQQATFRTQAQQLGIRYQELRSYQTLFNGFSVMATASEANRLSRMSGVLNVTPVNEVPAPEVIRDLTPALEPDMFYAKGMTGADIAQNELGLTGKGIKVGVIDTGIDIDHPAFQGRVLYGYDFVGDDYGQDGKYVPVPDDNPDDCGGHGTHVAGIVGGNDPATGFKGVAPDVTFGAYRIFGCSGSSYDDVILAAMERATADGMQVVNMSLGSAFTNWKESPLPQAANRMVKKGIVMVASAGNSGDSGQYSMGGPTMGDQVISVASVDNVKGTFDSFKLSNNTKVAYNPTTGSPRATIPTTLPITKKPGSSTTTTNDGCTVSGGFAAGSLTGKAVLIRRGTCSFNEKAANAQAAGAAAVILYNNTVGMVNATVATGTTITIPVVGISDVDGAAINALIDGAGVSMTFDGGQTGVNSPTANASSYFSSFGMSAELEFKPDLGAPGGSIYSTYPLSKEARGYATLSGTSMSSPHVAGGAALMLQAYPNIVAKDMRTLLMNTASMRWYLNGTALAEGIPDYVQRQGAGMLNLVSAYNNTVRATPSKLSLGESDGMATRSKVVVLKNTGSKREVFNVSHYPALTAGGTTYVPTPFPQVASVSINGTNVDNSTMQVVLEPFAQMELNVDITAPAGAPDKSQYGGYVYMESATGSNLVVPYSGFKGDYQSIKSFGTWKYNGTTYQTPLLEDTVGTAWKLWQPGATIGYVPEYSMAGGDNVLLLVNRAHQIRTLTMEVLDASGLVIDTLMSEDYVSRDCSNDYSKQSSTCGTFTELEWDGKLSNGQEAPNGTYQLRLSALKPLGDASNPAHTEVYTSQPFAIVRPPVN
ncbi:S8 family serine peptidase [Deinococcus daejeonensis]|uniref:Peptidase S8 and S53 subtilisin kexin sedolisin n=1 Tax=Deinococcus daejeonensis TaxID=1007098 RepID=A0ABQ2IYF2_9DEIO|nr:S8 family serine peptidase [Deinococcus daejeonensis]GGN34892.1 hypothetical protein GCM10010842_14120 [Deinococcus daejeonensis]